MNGLIAAIPLAAVIGMLVWRGSARRAAAAGLIAAVILTLCAFPTRPAALMQAGLDWAPTVVEVMFVLAGGILFAEAGRVSGDQRVIASWVTRSLGAGSAPVLAIVHGFTPLTESLTGYGIGAALAIPLLLGIGIPAKRAAVVGLLGLCTVPWGSMAPGTLIASQLTGVDFELLGVMTAVCNGVVAIVVGLWAALLTARQGARLRGAAAGVCSGLALWASVLASNLVVGTAAAGAVGGLLVLLLHLAVLGMRGRRLVATSALARAAAPYAIVLGGMLITTLLFHALHLPGGVVDRILGSPALWLWAAAGSVWLRLRGDLGGAVAGAVSTWVRVAPATVMFVALGALMGVNGMSAALAAQLAWLGASYPFFLPVCAALIGFVAGSNSGANALAAGALADVAHVLGLDVPLAAGMQNTAGAAAMMASPARVELATRLAHAVPARRRVQLTMLLVLMSIVLPLGLLNLLSA